MNGHRWGKIPIYVGFENEKRNDKMREGKKEEHSSKQQCILMVKHHSVAHFIEYVYHCYQLMAIPSLFEFLFIFTKHSVL